MKRIFRARITWYQYLFLIILGLLAFWLLWQMIIIPAALCMLLIVFLVERFIHTTYTVTADGKLEISHGRFSKKQVIELTDIVDLQIRCSPLGRLIRNGYLLLEYGDGKFVALQPAKELEFIKFMSL